MPIGGGQGIQGREGGGGIGIKPEIEVQGIGRVCTESGLREALREEWALETWRHMERPLQGRRTVSLPATDGWRDRNASNFSPIVVFYDDAYGGVMDLLKFHGGWGGGIQRNGG